MASACFWGVLIIIRVWWNIHKSGRRIWSAWRWQGYCWALLLSICAKRLWSIMGLNVVVYLRLFGVHGGGLLVGAFAGNAVLLLLYNLWALSTRFCALWSRLLLTLRCDWMRRRLSALRQRRVTQWVAYASWRHQSTWLLNGVQLGVRHLGWMWILADSLVWAAVSSLVKGFLTLIQVILVVFILALGPCFCLWSLRPGVVWNIWTRAGYEVVRLALSGLLIDYRSMLNDCLALYGLGWEILITCHHNWLLEYPIAIARVDQAWWLVLPCHGWIFRNLL